MSPKTRRAFGSIFDLSTKLTTIKHTIVAEQLRTKFSRASVSAAKQCTGTARDVEMFAMADVKRISVDVKNCHSHH
ncbi:hypothetical protein TcWFU_010364 [Taenia crassiceps]|uniref:Uncharacterized protein n=1 Tax=Taenia crassiceps TaxID=6207 RepID=A0ABR4QJ73_9CEST